MPGKRIGQWGDALERLALKKIEVWLAGLLAILGLAAGCFWGYAVGHWHVFPYDALQNISAFVKGDVADHRPLSKRFFSQVKYDPTAFPAHAKTVLLPPHQLRLVRAAANAGGIMPDVSGIKYHGTEGPTRYFVVLGSFVFPDQSSNWGTIAVDTNGVIHRGWSIQPDEFKFLGAHIGLALTNDGLVASNINGVLTGYSWCGDKKWEADWAPLTKEQKEYTVEEFGNDWHHDIKALDGRLYTFRGAAIMMVDAATGKTLSKLHAVDLMQWGWKDNISLFEARTRAATPYNENIVAPDSMHKIFVKDPFHFNKVDVLSKELAPLYPDFEAGDMLISARDLNLVVVVRPSEQRIVWWRYGLSNAQHDATFIDGHVEVFDNNPVSVPPAPRIARFDLTQAQAETLFDLSGWKMKMPGKGNFERHGDRMLTVDDPAGRVIAGRLDGSIDFVLENGWKNKKGKVIKLQLRNATEVSPADFARFEASCQK